MSELPLAAAQARLGRPGRPRVDTLEAQSAARTRADSGQNRGAPDTQSWALPPRLLDLARACDYLSLQRSSFLELEAAGVVSRARVIVRGREIRKRLYDRLQ